jgi:gamma-glutamyltranspeptidase/glutathione hydrolase
MTNHTGWITFLYYEAKTGRIHQLDGMGGFPSGLPPFKPIPQAVGSYAQFPPSAVIPGFMASLKEIHGRFATCPWKELCKPAVEWAERGHPVSSFEYAVNLYGEKFILYFPEGREFYQPNGVFSLVGEVFVPRGLAETLSAVAEQGPDYMITGEWGEKFIAKANQMGWKIRPEHMTETPPRWVEPIRYRHREYEIVSLGPPQTQGLYVGVALGILKHLGIRDMEPGSAEHWWAMGHALRQAGRHWEYAQDDLIYGIPREEILDDGYHAHLARMIRRARPKVDLTEHIKLTGDMAAYEGGKPRLGRSDGDQPSGSCEIAVVDSDGNWVQMMDTLQGGGIPGMVIDGVPMVGSHATFAGLMSPIDATLVKGAKARNVLGNTLVLKSGKPILSAGTPGNVYCTMPQVLTYALDFGLEPYAAIDAPRMLPMTESRSVTIEDRLAPGVVEDLHRLGVRVAVTSGYDWHMGSFSVIARDEHTEKYSAVADPRRCAVADGIK